METLKIVAVIAVSAVLMLLLWNIKAALYRSLPKNEEPDFPTLEVRNAAELEYAVRRMMWLRKRDGLADNIIIDCEGYDGEMLQMARIFAREHDYIKLINNSSE